MAEPAGAIANVGVGLGSAMGASLGTEMEKRMTGLACGVGRVQRGTRATMLPPTSRATSTMAGLLVPFSAFAISVNCNITSWAVDQRCSESFARQMAIVLSSAGGMPRL